jgi:predicted O-methyltransferase YrrM
MPDGSRRLELNEGQAIHSLYRPWTVLTDNYWDGYLVLPFTVRATPPSSVAILGTAAGTVARAYARYFPATRIDAVDIDAKLFWIGRRYFGLRARPQLHEIADDARPFLRRTSSRYDSIFLDAYRQPYIPFYLATREFFSLARSRLNRGGTVIVNVGHPAGSDALEKAISATMGRVFAHVARDPITATNTLLVGSDAPVSALSMTGAVLPDPLARLAERQVVQPPLRGGEVFTDDRAPVEWLIDTSIVRYAAGEASG